MKRLLWKMELAWVMMWKGWGTGSAMYALKGGYDSYFDNPDEVLRGGEVLDAEMEAAESL